MPKFRDWFWQLEESGKGPDHFFSAAFDPNEAEVLANLVRQYLPSGFVSNNDFVEDHWRTDCQCYKSYRDQHTHDGLVAMRANGQQNNIYISSSIDICDHKLSIENMYARHEPDETEFLIAVVQSAGLTLQEWIVFAGGDGYNSVEVARGLNALSFLEYLQYECD